MNFDEIAGADIALERQLRLILSTLGNVTEGYDYYQFRCNVCGDSQKNKSKRRGYILKKKQPYMYFCHNCFAKMTVLSWMKEFFPAYYKDYYREILRSNGDKKQKALPKISNPKIKKRSPEKDHTKFFIPIKKGITPLFAKAMRVCIDRKIPEEVWEKWFVSTGGMYHDRLIIPFFDKEDKIYYYQGRALKDGLTPKYLSRAGEHISIYNYYSVDKNKPVVVLEGPIDSIFVENSIAVTGVKIDDVRLKDFPHKRFLIDYDAETKDTKKKTIELLTRGEYVFNWKKFMKEYNLPSKAKWDINDVCLYLNKDKFLYEELEQFFTNSIFDKVFFV